MATLRRLRKAGAHSNQDTRPRDTSSPRPVVAPDSQPPPTTRKRKHSALSPEQQDSLKVQQKCRHKKHRTSSSTADTSSSTGDTSSSTGDTSSSTWDQRQRQLWDSLSRVWLASDALRELNRRNALIAAENRRKVSKVEPLVIARDVEHFARHGGPDLSDLRQYPNYCAPSSISITMPSKSERHRPRRRVSEDPDPGRPRKRSSAYSPNFGQLLADSGVTPVSRDHRAANHREWNDILVQPRPSLSPSRMSDGHHERFLKAIDIAENEDEVMVQVFPKIVGEPRHPARYNTKLGNLEPLREDIVVPQPDYYEGNSIGPGSRQLRKRLDKSIVPSVHTHYPFLPNFFTEVKGLEGTMAVAQRQVCHNGAVGARAMHRVENLGRQEEYFDNKARTASVILHGAGNLRFFSHHVSPPGGPGTPMQTHMTPLQAFSLESTPDTFRQGVGAFRNASDYARQFRKESIENAHRRARIITPDPPTPPPRSTRRPLSCQRPILESSDSETNNSSSEEDESDDDNHRKSSRARPKGKVPKPQVVTATPTRLAKRKSAPPTRKLRPRRPRR